MLVCIISHLIHSFIHCRTRPIRHGKKKLKRDKINALNKPKQTTQKQIGNFSELWIRVEEIR